MLLLERIRRAIRSFWLPAIFPVVLLAAQCNSVTPALPSTPTRPALRVAILSPTSGELATQGRMMRNGVVMAFDEWNRQGGVNDHRLEWIFTDTDCTFEMARQATRQAINDGVDFIIGPLCSEAAIATASVANQAQVITISPAATHPLVTIDDERQVRPHSFRVSFAYPLQGQAAARFAHNVLNVNKVALLSDLGNDYANELIKAFSDQFLAEGGAIVYESAFAPANDDLTEILRAIRRSGAELIYLPTSTALANQVAQRLNELDLSTSQSPSETRPILLGSDAWISDELDLIATAGSYFPLHFSPEVDHNLVRAWAEAYKSIYAVEPSTLAALGYDAANILASAIDQSHTIDPIDVTDTLEHSTFQGITGQISFDQLHNPVKPVHFVRVQDGRITLITSIF